MYSFLRQALKRVYRRLKNIHDSPQRTSAGFGIGVFTGILPGAGPLAALVLSQLLRVNRLSALAGSLATNTWMSVLTFVFAAKLGAAVTGHSWKTIYAQARLGAEQFRWKEFLNLSFGEVIFPLLAGYLLIGLMCGLTAYLSALIVLHLRRHKRLR